MRCKSDMDFLLLQKKIKPRKLFSPKVHIGFMAEFKSHLNPIPFMHFRTRDFPEQPQYLFFHYIWKKQMEVRKIIYLILSASGFLYGLKLFIDASQPCGSDGCLIHLLYFIAIPLLIVSGIFFTKMPSVRSVEDLLISLKWYSINKFPYFKIGRKFYQTTSLLALILASTYTLFFLQSNSY